MKDDEDDVLLIDDEEHNETEEAEEHLPYFRPDDRSIWYEMVNSARFFVFLSRAQSITNEKIRRS